MVYQGDLRGLDYRSRLDAQRFCTDRSKLIQTSHERTAPLIPATNGSS